MLLLDKALRTWGTPEFEAVLKQEIAQVGAGQLPLQEGVSSGSYVKDAPLNVVIHDVAETDGALRVKAGIFYQSVIAGGSCDDDPTPAGENTEYCELLLEIDKVSAATSVTLLS